MNEEINTNTEERVVDAEVVEKVQEQPVQNEPQQTTQFEQPQQTQTTNPNGYNPTFQPKNNTNTGNGNNGTVPPTNNNGPQIIYVERPRKPFPWKAVLKYVCIFLVAGLCGFGGGLLANNFDSNKNDVEEYNNYGPQFPGFSDDDSNAFGGFGYSDGNSDSSNSNGSSSSKTNTNSAGIGIQIKESDDGVYIVGFSADSNAESAGLKIGDKITALDGKEYNTYDDIVSYLSDKEVGDVVEVTVERDDEKVTVSVELSAMSSSQSSLPSSDSSDVY